MRSFESKASFIVGYLKEISHFLTATSIPSNSAVQQNITIWEDYLNNFKENLDRLNNFYKKVRADMISTGKFTMTWPDIPEFPKDEDNIIFASFKPAIKNIIEIEEKLLKNFKPTVQSSVQPSPQVTQTIPYAVSTPHFPVQRSSYFIGSGLYYPTIPPPITIQPNNITQLHPQLVRERVALENLMQQPIPVEPRMRQNLQMSKSTECLSKPAEKMKEDKSKGTLSEATASNTKEPIDKKYQEKEKILFEYVIEKCPGSSEEDVTFALLHVVDENKGSLAKLSKEKVVEEVKMALRMKKQSAWVTPKSPHVQWHNDHSERNCSICFEDFSVKEMFTLQCQHEYHKECIKKWLKTSSVCPICRVHSVIDEDFPPLH
ncbi:hypothetical protein NQ318_017954 [Aromia moschata]|uniref:RING-type domain-containing protein n=1 Tax=Aromia moschata TaxID=1265417 RepID=A0AAV8Y3Q2_9CUCU|nr:hypothetical protein NQ318_017954 [Aromia moschata]